MTNPDVYPITAAFEKEVKDLKLNEIGRAISARMQSHLNEYEHGVAEPEVLFSNELREHLEQSYNRGDTLEEKEESKKFFLTRSALLTMKEMFIDLLQTYWTSSQPPEVTVWMPDDETAMSPGVQEDVVRAVTAAKGHMMTDEGWNYVAVGPQPFNAEDASKAMTEQSGEKALEPEAWREQKINE
jgi:hypothetical protein